MGAFVPRVERELPKQGGFGETQPNARIPNHEREASMSRVRRDPSFEAPKAPNTERFEGDSTRRSFLRRVAAASAVFGAPSIFTRGGFLGAASPNETIRVGMIGVGGHGIHRNLAYFLRQSDALVNVVCDVFDDRKAKAKTIVDDRYGTKTCEAVTDFRRVLDRKDVDSVMISTPDHWHVLMSVLAMRAGKDVICEKPTLTIEEGRILSDTVAKHRAVFQTSTEDRSLECYHRMAQVVRAGLIGDVRKVAVELPAGTRYPHEEPIAVPPGFDYELWLGPAPAVPLTANRTEHMHWRHVFDYSGGILTDWGMHQLDTVQWALDVERTGPVEIEGRGVVNEGSMYDTYVEYEVKLRYASGVEVEVRSGGTSLRFEGTRGWIGNPHFAAPCTASSDDYLAWEPKEASQRLPREPAGEHRNFLDCVKSRAEPYFPAEVGHRCSTLCHLGNIAMKLGRKLRWDPVREEFPNDAAANELRGRAMRAPWTLEA
jgi:myo-inositol 2-dehydrogenase/D-chiro-inositol 1-dehydrogenase